MCRISMNEILNFCNEYNLEFKNCKKHIKAKDKDTGETLIISRKMFKQIKESTNKLRLLKKHYRKNQIIPEL